MVSAGAAPKTASERTLGEELDAISRDLDATGLAWVEVGYPDSGPEFEAREAVFARLRDWNTRAAGRLTGSSS